VSVVQINWWGWLIFSWQIGTYVRDPNHQPLLEANFG